MGEETTGQAASSPAAYFGAEVRVLRATLGLSQELFAERLHYKQAQVSKVESGTVLASESFAAAMDRTAGTPGVYTRLRARLSERGHPDWFIPYVALERGATKIEDFSNALIMGMLQTSDYAEATFRATHPRESDEQIRARVAARLERGSVMDRESPPLLWVILHESTLRTVVGGRAVMRAQLDHLAVQAATPHITLQVLPFSAGASPSAVAFILLTQDDERAIVYSETADTGYMSDSVTAVASAEITYERLRAAALSSEVSLSLIQQIAEEYAP